MTSDRRSVERSALTMIASGDYLAAINIVRAAYDDPKNEPHWEQAPELSELLPGYEFIDWSSVGMAVSPADSLFNLAVSVWKLEGQENSAIEILRLADEQGSHDARPVLADYLLWLKRFREAEEVIGTIEPESILASPRLSGVVGALQFEYRHSIDARTVQLLTESLGESEDFKLILADVFVSRGDWTKAKDILTELVGAGNREAPIKLGNLLRDHLFDFGGAEAAFRLGIVTGDTFSAYNLGTMLLKLPGRSGEAREWIQYAADRGDSKAIAKLRKLASASH